MLSLPRIGLSCSGGGGNFSVGGDLVILQRTHHSCACSVDGPPAYCTCTIGTLAAAALMPPPALHLHLLVAEKRRHMCILNAEACSIDEPELRLAYSCTGSLLWQNMGGGGGMGGRTRSRSQSRKTS